MKKNSSPIIGLACVITLSLPSFVSAQTATTTQETTQQTTTAPSTPMVLEPAFKDVDVGDDHYIAIKYLKDHQIINGYDDGTFQPARQINRAEALKIILNAIKKTTVATTKQTETKTFPDVPSDAWFAQYVQTGVSNGIISGYADGTFQPDRTINKVECLKMVLLQKNSTLPVTINEPPYSDIPVDEWFSPYAQVSKEQGLFLETRSAGALEPAGQVNRGDFAELMYRTLQSNEGYYFGRATYYSDELAGRGTSSGDPYNPGVFTTAHKTLPFGTKLEVTNLANGKSVEVKVNDRGPYATGVELDLSKSAFSAIASPSEGIIVTQFKILEQP